MPKNEMSSVGYVRKPVPELLEMWSTKPDSIVYRAIEIVFNSTDHKICCDNLKRELQGISTNPGGVIASLCTNAGRAYGKVLRRIDGFISILPEYQDIVRRLWTQDIR